MIEFKKVSFQYERKGQLILNNVSFKIGKGEIVAIVGKNGAGKTTLLKHINGLLKPSKGEIFINNENIAKKKISEMASKIGLAFQNPNHQLFAKTVYEELEFGPKNLDIESSKSEQLVKKTASQFNITHLLDKNPLELSGGERRLVSIASVLTMGQEILILDEPTYGQDYRQKKRLGDFLVNLAKLDKTIVVVSHDIDFIFDFIPRVIILDDGEIIADGPTEILLCNTNLIEKSDLELPISLDLIMKLEDLLNVTLEKDSSNIYSLLSKCVQQQFGAGE